MRSSSWQCPLCKITISGNNSRSAHYRNLWKSADDPSRCDVRLRGIALHAAGAADVITVPQVIGAQELTRRKVTTWQDQRAQRNVYRVQPFRHVSKPPRARDMLAYQDSFAKFRADVRRLCSEDFWQFFLALHKCSTAAIDAALKVAKQLFIKPKTAAWKAWPPSKRALFSKINSVTAFWPKVIHSVDIDLSMFTLPSGTSTLKFEFIDPLWGWLCAARRIHPLDLHWRAVQQPLTPMYGGGVQFGQAFQLACQSCPPGGYPMCISVHWDGTGARGLTAVPICVGVVNTNRSTPDAHFCLGYMPKTPDTNKVSQVHTIRLVIALPAC